MKRNTHPIYTGAFFLTLTGLICRFIGFYYKIFLSRAIGAKELGLYQLAMPLLGFGIAFSNSGIHTAISKYVAGASASDSKEKPKHYLVIGLLISLCLGMLFSCVCFFFADTIAADIFQESSIAPLLRILLLCVPLECIHGCINGYYYGLQKAVLPSGGQCIEQLVRVGSVMAMYTVLGQSGLPFTKTSAMLGLFFGELAATLYYLTALSLQKKEDSLLPLPFQTVSKKIWRLAYPVTASRISLTLASSLENIMIPVQLTAYGLNNTQALSVYGIYSGMALPMIYFPTVLSNSVAVMLLPSIAKAKEEKRTQYILHSVVIGFFLCMLLGFFCAFFFFFFGPFIGEKIFQNEVAGIYIRTLAWLCPFLFLSVTMNSILNGLGRTRDTFFIHITGALIRLAFIFFGIRRYGFRAFLLGVLISQVIASFTAYIRLMKICTKKGQTSV